MKSVFISKNKAKIKPKMKRSIACRAMGISLTAIMTCSMLPSGRITVYASEEKTGLIINTKPTEEESTMNYNTTTASPTGRSAAGNARDIQTPLDLSNVSSDQGNLNTDGYQWISSSKTLKLKDFNINSIVTLPDDTVIIETEGDCSILELSAVGNPQKAQITFSGTGMLTIQNEINIYGGDNNSLTIASGAHVVARGGINIGSSGGVNSIVTVNGTLTVEGNTASSSNVLSAGKVIVGSGGTLNVSGNNGVALYGMKKGGFSKDFTDVFTVKKGGCFTANCNTFNVKVYSGSSDSFPAGSNADKAINIPDGYLPADCEVKQSKTEINFVKKSTGDIYNKAMAIHENHNWSGNWTKDETGHWKVCTLEGCGKTNGYAVHNYDGSTWKCTVCGAVLAVTLNDADGLTYDGQEHTPGAAVTVDNIPLDASKYETSYNNNINAGEASVTVTGKDGQTFKRTVQFQIARVVPTITWNNTVQTVTYSGSQAVITPPAVMLINGEIFNGEINYSHAASGSANYTAGLPVNAGTYTVKAHTAEQENYTAADSADLLTLTIDQAENAPNMPSDTMNVAKKCETVNDVELPADWQWQDTDQNTPLEIGVPATATAVYTGADKDNYKNITSTVIITRSNCDHENTEVRNAVAATCLQKGYSGDTYCLDCGELLTKGRQTDLAGHSGGTASCVSGKICTVCGTEYTAKDSNVHLHTEIRGRKKASCDSNGYTGDTYCTDCNTKISSGRVIPATGHKWQVTGRKDPTYTENGVITYTCSLCGDTYTTLTDKLQDTVSKPENASSKTIPAAKGKRSPQTGEP